MSEYATLSFLRQIGTVPTPKIHGAAFDCNDLTKALYCFMEKMPGLLD